jgi:rhodanese-related sulfurtransferase
MSTGPDHLVGEVSPTEAWELLEGQDAVLVDVRTHAEWTFVGVPDLSGLTRPLLTVEWASFPGMSKNPRFVAQVLEELGKDVPSTLLFICRSGARSLNAAQAVAAHLASEGRAATCLNVAEGFEGDLSAMGQRGDHNGWKARGLAWRQS